MRFLFYFSITIIPLIWIICMLVVGVSNGYDYANQNINVKSNLTQPLWMFGNQHLSHAQIIFPKVLSPHEFMSIFNTRRGQLLGNNGSGQSVLLLESGDSFSFSDLMEFDQAMNIPTAKNLVTTFRLGGPNLYPNPETTLDVEWTHALVPKAHIDIVMLGNNFTNQELYRITKYLNPTVISVSFGPIPLQSIEIGRNLTSQLSFLRSLSNHYPVFFAAGDNHSLLTIDAYPNIVAVGGVDYTGSLKHKIKNSTLLWWNQSGYSLSDFSFYRPSWQFTTSSIWRTTPDLEMLSGQPFVWIYQNGRWFPIGGTSLAAPICASLWALADAAHMQLHGTPLPPSPNPILYSLAKTNPKLFLHIKSPINSLGVPRFSDVIQALRSLSWKKQQVMSYSSFPLHFLLHIARVVVVLLCLWDIGIRFIWLKYFSMSKNKNLVWINIVIFISYGFIASGLGFIPSQIARNTVLSLLIVLIVIGFIFSSVPIRNFFTSQKTNKK